MDLFPKIHPENTTLINFEQEHLFFSLLYTVWDGLWFSSLLNSNGVFKCFYSTFSSQWKAEIPFWPENLLRPGCWSCCAHCCSICAAAILCLATSNLQKGLEAITSFWSGCDGFSPPCKYLKVVVAMCERAMCALRRREWEAWGIFSTVLIKSV